MLPTNLCTTNSQAQHPGFEPRTSDCAFVEILHFVSVGTSRCLHWQKRSISTKAQSEPNGDNFLISCFRLCVPKGKPCKRWSRSPLYYYVGIVTNDMQYVFLFEYVPASSIFSWYKSYDEFFYLAGYSFGDFFLSHALRTLAMVSYFVLRATYKPLYH